jgi:hypothetical protein
MSGQQDSYFDVPPTELELNKQLEQMHIVYDQLSKDYHKRGQELTFEKALTAKLLREKEEIEKQFNDMVMHTQAKMESITEQIIEIPCKTMYGLAFDWQQPSDSVFVVVKDGEVTLRTREEIDPDRKPTFRHWWKGVNVM